MIPKTADPYSGAANLEVMTWALRYNTFLRHLVRNHAPVLDPADLVVDFGAGIGTFSDVFDPARQTMLCIEADPQQREALQAKGFRTASLDEVADGSATYIYSLNVLEHIDDDVEVLRALADKLKTGGRLMIYVPAFLLLWTAMDDEVGHVRRYRRQELAEKIGKAGLRIEHSAYADSAGFFATLLFKTLKSSKGNAKGNAGTLSKNAVVLFDRLAFPVGRVLDRVLFSRWLGKNALIVATKSP